MSNARFGQCFHYRENALSMAEKLKDIAQIYAIGITNETDDALLSALSSGGVENRDWYNTPTFEGLQDIRDQVIQQTCVAATPSPDLGPTTTLLPPTTSQTPTITPGTLSTTVRVVGK